MIMNRSECSYVGSRYCETSCFPVVSCVHCVCASDALIPKRIVSTRVMVTKDSPSDGTIRC